jgi:NO-binding membrane sensor protein with MHYT domain
MQMSAAPWLVLLSVVLAVEGGYLALRQTMQIEAAVGSRRRARLAGAAFAFGIAVWAMHFTALLTVDGAEFFVALPVLLALFAGVLIAGTAVYAVSAGVVTSARLSVAACLLAAAIVVMHGIGVSALPARIIDNLLGLIVSIAIALAGSALALWLTARQSRPLAGAVAFGIATAAAHYVAMAGTTLVPTAMLVPAPVLSTGMLAVVIAIVAFAVTALFLLLLVPERTAALELVAAAAATPAEFTAQEPATASAAGTGSDDKLRRGIYAPLGGAGAPPPRLADHLPIERDGATQFVPVEEVVAVQANAHYTYLFDGKAKLFCPLAIGEVESRLDRGRFLRVHRSHIVNIERVIGYKRSGDSETVELAAEEKYTVPVSRSRAGWLKSRIDEKNGGAIADKSSVSDPAK